MFHKNLTKKKGTDGEVRAEEMKMMQTRATVFVALSTFAIAALAESQATVRDDALSDYFSETQPRFQPYEPNYILWQDTDSDDDALEARYSFKYLISRPDCVTRRLFSTSDSAPQEGAGGTVPDCDSKEFGSRWEFYLKYTGEFDFYFGTRDSGPVINRISNPGLHLRRYLDNHAVTPDFFVNYLDVGIQHLSNGQTEEATRERVQRRAQTVFDRDPFDPFLDTISREVDFLSVEINGRFGPFADNAHPVTGRCNGSPGCYDYWVRLIPHYFSDSNPVTWGVPGGPRPSEIADYERIRFILSRRHEFAPDRDSRIPGIRELTITAAWRIGDELLDTDSFDISVYMPIRIWRGISLPLFVEYHNGPLNNLSNFSVRQDSIGVGLRFN